MRSTGTTASNNNNLIDITRGETVQENFNKATRKFFCFVLFCFAAKSNLLVPLLKFALNNNNNNNNDNGKW